MASETGVTYLVNWQSEHNGAQRTVDGRMVALGEFPESTDVPARVLRLLLEAHN
jgi:hypothetical protein